jgi:hypothetical protein
VPQANTKVAKREIRQAALRRRLAVAENISDPTKGFNERRLTFAVYLAAKTIDVHIYDVGVRVDTHPPNLIENHRASDDTAWVATEILEESELLGCEAKSLTTT